MTPTRRDNLKRLLRPRQARGHVLRCFCNPTLLLSALLLLNNHPHAPHGPGCASHRVCNPPHTTISHAAGGSRSPSPGLRTFVQV